MQFYYILSIHNKENDELAGVIEALTKESLEEQLRKIPTIEKNYEAKMKELKELSDEETL